MTIPRSHVLRGLGPVLASTLILSGCSGSSSEEDEPSPEEVLASAKTNLDKTPGVHVVLSTEKLPKNVDGILSADGIGTHPAAFEGDLKVAASGITADVAVVAVDDVVYAMLPFTTRFVEIDPADYGAPDPAVLMGTEAGLSSLLTEAEDVKKGEDKRDGEAVVTSYTGTVPGEAVTSVIPTASADASFDANFTITENDRLNSAVLTGSFYPGGGDVTYTIEFDKYGTEKEITAP